MNRTKKFIQSFRHAFRGFWYVLRHESSFTYMSVTAVGVLVGMFYFRTNRQENVALLTMIFAVLALELMKTAFERLMDFLNPDHDERIKDIKDMLAAIVLVVSCGAAIIGSIIFFPHLRSLF